MEAISLIGPKNTQLLKSRGRVSVQKDRISVNINPDFCEYYRKLIYFAFPNLKDGLSLAKHKPHITIGNPKLHRINQSAANQFDGRKVEFFYDPTSIYLGGFRKGFVGFYLNIISPQIEEIKRKVVISEESPGSLHLTICSSKHLK
jgi:hypothetical protein